MHPDTLFTQMNDYGKRHIPFLFAVDFECIEALFVPRPLEQKKVLFHTPLGTNVNAKPVKPANKGDVVSYPEPYPHYHTRFRVVKKGLERGDSFLTNLTVKTRIETTLSLKEIFDLSNAPYSLYVPGKFVCFSPERFVHIVDGVISTNPMKGTIDASIPDAENMILQNAKETAEHSTVVDLLRNDLGMVATNISVDRFRYIDRISTSQRDILQVSSEISGCLSDDYREELGTMLSRILPAGSISGAPKQSTLDIIRRAEGESRGFYTGVFGYFDGHAFDSGVLIRFIEEQEGTYYFRSGGGITAFSDPKSEYDEVLEKIYLPCNS